jgi:Bacterial SH3 domain
MTRLRVFRGRIGILSAALLASAVFGGVVLAAVATVAVTVKQTSVRSDHQFFAPTLATAHFTERLEVLGEEQGWYRVRYGAVTGWVHSSAVSEAGRGGGAAPGALSGVGSALGVLAGRAPEPASTNKGYTEDEVALAGKGFNQNVEEQYRSRYPRADFSAVDKLERLHAGSDEIRKFASAGHLIAVGQPPAGRPSQPRDEPSGGGSVSFVIKPRATRKGSDDRQRESQGVDPWSN